LAVVYGCMLIMDEVNGSYFQRRLGYVQLRVHSERFGGIVKSEGIIVPDP
jgi:hypothetical protein